MTKIIGFAGRKQSGKSTCCNFLLGLKLHEYGICEKVSLNKDGNIIVSDIFGDTVPDVEWIPLTEEYVDVSQLFDNFNPCKRYAFADPLKEFLINVLGLEHKQLYGTDDDKNSLTHLKWEDMPRVYSNKKMYKLSVESNPDLEDILIYHKSGRMTAREVMQFFGTEICRKMSYNLWVDAILRRINKEAPELALISDVRFDNETNGLKKENNALVIGLTRDIYKDDQKHDSEKINFSLCDHVIDNQDMTMEDMLQEVYKIVSQFHTFKLKVA